MSSISLGSLISTVLQCWLGISSSRFGPLVGKGFANADHIDGRVRYPIDPQHIVHLPIVVASDVDTAEVQGCGDQIDILGQVAGLEEDEAVAARPVLERRALEKRGHEDQE